MYAKRLFSSFPNSDRQDNTKQKGSVGSDFQIKAPTVIVHDILSLGDLELSWMKAREFELLGNLESPIVFSLMEDRGR